MDQSVKDAQEAQMLYMAQEALRTRGMAILLLAAHTGATDEQVLAVINKPIPLAIWQDIVKGMVGTVRGNSNWQYVLNRVSAWEEASHTAPEPDALPAPQ